MQQPTEILDLSHMIRFVEQGTIGSLFTLLIYIRHCHKSIDTLLMIGIAASYMLRVDYLTDHESCLEALHPALVHCMLLALICYCGRSPQDFLNFRSIFGIAASQSTHPQ
jgi:hypothetical protein